MDKDVLGLIIAILMIALVLFIVMVLKKRTNLSDEMLRKIVHITVSNWWLFNLFYIKNPNIALIAPIIFIFVNSIFVFKPDSGYKFGFASSRRNIGLVYFPLSFLILIYLCSINILSYTAGTIGALSMGYGDGFAALIGLKWGKRKISKRTGDKTYIGTIAMAIICNFVSLITLLLSTDLAISSIVLISIIIGISGAIIELITPKNFDNLSVPIFIALIANVLI
ncbi:MAG: hypothetical protein JJE21_02145 [Spirochaetaceae bacterium]|nr:hypothetical protein [Spirochaetaceae bacterium]